MDVTIPVDYHFYLKFEKGLSPNSIDAYERDLLRLFAYLSDAGIKPEEAEFEHVRDFVVEIASIGIHPRSQARIISGVKSYYHFLIYKNKITIDPTSLIESPKIGLYLPDVLSVSEIDAIVNAIDLSHPLGMRNKAIIEILYGSGLRVSELIAIRLSRINAEEGYMLVEGKGSKQRLVPLSPPSLKCISAWMIDRNLMQVQKGNEEYLFLNKRGVKLTRAMIFEIVKRTSLLAGIKKNISPHTFRHSFATHLLENGAHVRAIQLLLGHESITTTEMYTHIDMQLLRKTIQDFHPLYKPKS